jgi:predicted RNase H-like nuclease
VGQSVADSLVSERNDITVIDTDAERLRDLESRFDALICAVWWATVWAPPCWPRQAPKTQTC